MSRKLPSSRRCGAGIAPLAEVARHLKVTPKTAVLILEARGHPGYRPARASDL